jgi:hypothetical protein
MWQIAKVIHETNIKLEEIYNFQICFHQKTMKQVLNTFHSFSRGIEVVQKEQF